MEDAWINDVTLPVPIRFSNSAPSTKAAVVPDANDHFASGIELGIFAVNNRKTSSSSSASWVSSTDEDDFIWYKANEPEVAKLTTSSNGDVTFAEPQYYPISTSISFDFYGYYPFTDQYVNVSEVAVGNLTDSKGNPVTELKANKVTPTSTAAVVESGDNPGLQIEYTLGKNDILFAHAKGEYYTAKGSSSATKGFNAKYIRAITNDYTVGTDDHNILLPNLKFSHKLAKISIEVISGDKCKVSSPTPETINGNSVLSVSNVDISDVYTKATLLVTSANEDEVESGTLIPSVIGNIPLYNYDGEMNETPILNRLPKAFDDDLYGTYPEVYKLGYAFIYPTEKHVDGAPVENLTLDVYLAKKITVNTGTTESPVNEVRFQRDKTPTKVVLPYPTKGYQAGVEYTYRVVIHDAVEVAENLVVTLEDVGNYGDNADDRYVDESGSDIGFDPDSGPPVIDPDQSEYIKFSAAESYDYKAGEKSVKLYTSVTTGTWNISVEKFDPDDEIDPGTWVTDWTPSSGTGTGVDVKFTLGENTTGSLRKAKLVVTMETTEIQMKNEYVITQEAASVP